MPRSKKETAQTSPVETLTAQVILARADEALSELDSKEISINQHIRTAKEELAAIAQAREFRSAHIEALRHKIEALEAEYAQSVSYARLTYTADMTSPVTAELAARLLNAKDELAEAEIEHDKANKAALVRETELHRGLPDLQLQARAIARQCESIETARDRAMSECGRRRCDESKKSITHLRSEVKMAQRLLKARQELLSESLASIEAEFAGNDWGDYWEEIGEFIETLDLQDEGESSEDDE